MSHCQLAKFFFLMIREAYIGSEGQTLAPVKSIPLLWTWNFEEYKNIGLAKKFVRVCV